MTDLSAGARAAGRFAGEMWSSAADSAERTRIEMERHPELATAALILAGILGVLVVLVLRAAVRSSCRHQAAGLRDDLVDAVRTGEIDINEPRVFAMVDFCDRVARTGRRPRAGRHASSRPVIDSALAGSLLSAVGPGSLLPPGAPFWPSATADSGGPEVSDVWVRAVSFQQRLLSGAGADEQIEPLPTLGDGPGRRALISVQTGELPLVTAADPLTTAIEWPVVEELPVAPPSRPEASAAHQAAAPVVGLSAAPRADAPTVALPTIAAASGVPAPRGPVRRVLIDQAAAPDLSVDILLGDQARAGAQTRHSDRAEPAPADPACPVADSGAATWAPPTVRTDGAGPADHSGTETGSLLIADVGSLGAGLPGIDPLSPGPLGAGTDHHDADDAETDDAETDDAETDDIESGAIESGAAGPAEPVSAAGPSSALAPTERPAALPMVPNRQVGAGADTLASGIDRRLGPPPQNPMHGPGAVLHRSALVRLDPDAPVFDEVARVVAALMARTPHPGPENPGNRGLPAPFSPAAGIAGLFPARLGPLPRSADGTLARNTPSTAQLSSTGQPSPAVQREPAARLNGPDIDDARTEPDQASFLPVAGKNVPGEESAWLDGATDLDEPVAADLDELGFDPLTDPFFAPASDSGPDLEPVFLAASAAQREAEEAAREQAERDREREAEEQVMREGVARRWAALRQVADERAAAAGTSGAPTADRARSIDLRPLEEPDRGERQIDLTAADPHEPVSSGSPGVGRLTGGERPDGQPSRVGPSHLPEAVGRHVEPDPSDRPVDRTPDERLRSGPYVSPCPRPSETPGQARYGARGQSRHAGSASSGALFGETGGQEPDVVRLPASGPGGRHRRRPASSPPTNPIALPALAGGSGPAGPVTGAVGDRWDSSDPEGPRSTAPDELTGHGAEQLDAPESAVPEPTVLELDTLEAEALEVTAPESDVLRAGAPEPVVLDPEASVADVQVFDQVGSGAAEEPGPALSLPGRAPDLDEVALRPRWMSPGASSRVGGVVEDARERRGAARAASGDQSTRGVGLWGRRPRGGFTVVTGHGKPAGALVPFTGQVPVQGAAPEQEDDPDPYEHEDETVGR